MHSGVWTFHNKKLRLIWSRSKIDGNLLQLERIVNLLIDLFIHGGLEHVGRTWESVKFCKNLKISLLFCILIKMFWKCYLFQTWRMFSSFVGKAVSEGQTDFFFTVMIWCLRTDLMLPVRQIWGMQHETYQIKLDCDSIKWIKHSWVSFADGMCGRRFSWRLLLRNWVRLWNGNVLEGNVNRLESWQRQLETEKGILGLL